MQTLTIDKLAKVSFGNKKLPKGTMIFNIPAVSTCPFKTELCAKACYALKAERQYPNVLPAREYNLKLAKRFDFHDIMIATINKHIRKIKIIRIHESGDFFKQSYFDSWAKIAEAFPSLKFYAYTKSFFLDFSNKPKNLVLIASFDSSTPKDRIAHYEKNKAFFDNTFTIVDKKAKASCIADCTKCDKCWTKTGQNITVNIH